MSPLMLLFRHDGENIPSKKILKHITGNYLAAI